MGFVLHAFFLLLLYFYSKCPLALLLTLVNAPLTYSECRIQLCEKAAQIQTTPTYFIKHKTCGYITWISYVSEIARRMCSHIRKKDWSFDARWCGISSINCIILYNRNPQSAFLCFKSNEKGRIFKILILLVCFVSLSAAYQYCCKLWFKTAKPVLWIWDTYPLFILRSGWWQRFLKIHWRNIKPHFGVITSVQNIKYIQIDSREAV